MKTNKQTNPPTSTQPSPNADSKAKDEQVNTPPPPDNRDMSSNPEILRDRISKLVHQTRKALSDQDAIIAAQMEQIARQEQALGLLTAQVKEMDGVLATRIRAEGSGQAPRSDGTLEKVVLAGLECMERLWKLSGHTADPVLVKLLREAKPQEEGKD